MNNKEEVISNSSAGNFIKASDSWQKKQKDREREAKERTNRLHRTQGDYMKDNSREEGREDINGNGPDRTGNGIPDCFDLDGNGLYDDTCEDKSKRGRDSELEI